MGFIDLVHRFAAMSLNGPLEENDLHGDSSQEADSLNPRREDIKSVFYPSLNDLPLDNFRVITGYLVDHENTKKSGLQTLLEATFNKKYEILFAR